MPAAGNSVLTFQFPSEKHYAIYEECKTEMAALPWSITRYVEKQIPWKINISVLSDLFKHFNNIWSFSSCKKQ